MTNALAGLSVSAISPGRRTDAKHRYAPRPVAAREPFHLCDFAGAVRFVLFATANRGVS